MYEKRRSLKPFKKFFLHIYINIHIYINTKQIILYISYAKNVKTFEVKAVITRSSLLLVLLLLELEVEVGAFFLFKL